MTGPLKKLNILGCLDLGSNFFIEHTKIFNPQVQLLVSNVVLMEVEVQALNISQEMGRKWKHQHHRDGDKNFIQILPTNETEFLQHCTGIDASINFRILLQGD